MPRPTVEYSDRGITKDASQVVLRHSAKQPSDIVQAAEGHHLREKEALVGKGLVRRLPPDVLSSHCVRAPIAGQPTVQSRRGSAHSNTDQALDTGNCTGAPRSGCREMGGQSC